MDREIPEIWAENLDASDLMITFNSNIFGNGFETNSECEQLNGLQALTYVIGNPDGQPDAFPRSIRPDPCKRGRERALGIESSDYLSTPVKGNLILSSIHALSITIFQLSCCMGNPG
jgi:hypothetical protein